jgi:hypothetical protein
MNTSLIILDAGKKDVEHFEFNRGILLALEKVNISYGFVGMDSMLTNHKGISSTSRMYSSYAFWKFLPKSLQSITFKIFSIFLVLKALFLTKKNILVLYAPPVAHIFLSLFSNIFRFNIVIFLHGEIEFIANGIKKPKRIGEFLMLFALRYASPKIQYLLLTKYAADYLTIYYSASFRFIPHPISQDLFLNKNLNLKNNHSNNVALAFFKAVPDDLNVRLLLENINQEFAVNVNGSFLVQPSIQGNLSKIIEECTNRHFLTRDEIEYIFSESSIFIFTADSNQYKFTASGLACMAASLGIIVIGTSNNFMCEYSNLYPKNFVIFDNLVLGKPSLIFSQSIPCDNLSEIATTLKHLLVS